MILPTPLPVDVAAILRDPEKRKIRLALAIALEPPKQIRTRPQK